MFALARLAIAIVALSVTSMAIASTFQPSGCLADSFADSGGLGDQHGRSVVPARFAGRLTVVTLVQRDCDATCAMRMIDLDGIYAGMPPALARSVAFVAIDSGGRSAATLRRLAAQWRFGSRRWTLLRGGPAAISALRRHIDVVPADATEPSALVAVFDADGRLRQRYSGAPLDRSRVAREIGVVATLRRDAAPLTCSAPSLRIQR